MYKRDVEGRLGNRSGELELAKKVRQGEFRYAKAHAPGGIMSPGAIGQQHR